MEQKKIITFLSILIVVMAGVVGIVSQKINSIQQESDEKQSMAQVEYINARGLESVENQEILEDLMLLTEAKAQKSLIDSSSSILAELEQQYEVEETTLAPSIIKNEIDYYYLMGNQVFSEEWAKSSILNLCFRGQLECDVKRTTLYGTDNTEDAIEITFGLDLNEESAYLVQHVADFELEYDGYFSPYIFVDSGLNEVILQFPYYSDEFITQDTGNELLWFNEGYSYMQGYITSWISEYNYQIDVCETNVNFANDWVSTHKNNAASAERIWLTNQQIADTYYANGNDSMGDNISENADSWFDERNRLMGLANENKSVVHDWETMLYENSTQLYTYETWLIDEDNSIESEHSRLFAEISKMSSRLVNQVGVQNKIEELNSEILISDLLMANLITNTTAFEIGLISTDSPDFDLEDQKTYQTLMHMDSMGAYEEAETYEEGSRGASNRLETLSTSIVFLSMSNMVLGISAGMIKDKKSRLEEGSGKSDRNVLLLSAIGAILGIVGIILYVIS